jgi:glycosyltransferase involved in cell wall biosynthesis
LTKPLVSILLPVYNRERLSKRAIESAINQTYENIEIIIVDNKSTDRTYEVLKGYAKKNSKVKVYQNEENLGPVRNWKKCLEYSSGEFIKILFSDDWIDETFVEKCMEILLAHNNVGFVFTGTEIFHEDTGQKVKAYFNGSTGVYDTKKFIEGSLLGGPFPVSPGCALFRRLDVENNLVLEISNDLGLDFKRLGAGNDLLLFLLTASKYYYFGYISELLSHFGAHDSSISISNNLSLYYLTTKKYFIDNFIKDKNLRREFYSKLWLVDIKNKGKFRQLLIVNEIDIFQVLKIIMNYFWRKIKAIVNFTAKGRNK